MSLTIPAPGGGAADTANIAQVGGTTVVTGGVAGLLAVAGNVANAATDAGNPVKVGGVAQTGGTIPALTAGQRGDLGIGPNGGAIPAELTMTGTIASAATLSNFPLDVSGYATANVQFTSIGSGNTVVFEGSNDNFTTTTTLNVYAINSQTSTFPNGSLSPGTTSNYVVPLNFKYFRIRVSVYGSGTVTVIVQLKTAPWTSPIIATYGSLQPASTTNTSGGQLNANAILGCFDDVSPTVPTENNFAPIRMSANRALAISPHATPGESWSYAAAASGISNTTTAVTFKAADAALRNYITSMQISSDPLGAATELAIRDGAAGTVLWRMKIGTAGIVNGLQIEFARPIRGTAATLLEVVTLTASITGAVYFNAQGFAAS